MICSLISLKHFGPPYNRPSIESYMYNVYTRIPTTTLDENDYTVCHIYVTLAYSNMNTKKASFSSFGKKKKGEITSGNAIKVSKM